jgi:hypothetical protein
MDLPFLMMLLAAGILRYLAFEAKRNYHVRLAKLLPRNIVKHHFSVLTADYRDCLAAFRSSVLPLAGFQLVLNALSCAVFVGALWIFPPAALAEWDLMFIRYGGLAILPPALVIDALAFCRLFHATQSRNSEEGDPS